MTNAVEYTPGYSDNAVQFMAKRTAATHAGFFIPHLRPGWDLLDCGSGPGVITCGLARLVAPGRTVGVDASSGQVQEAESHAAAEKLDHLRFETASAESLPFAKESFDAVFSHALFEHLAKPDAVAREFLRVLRPGGIAGVRSPDWGGFVLHPIDPKVEEALAAYRRIQETSGGDTRVGRKLGAILKHAGFTEVIIGAEFELYPDRTWIADYLALRLEKAGLHREAHALRTWSAHPDSLFAQAWFHAVGKKPVAGSGS